MFFLPWLGTAFATVFAFLADIFAKRIAVSGVVIAAFIGLVVTFKLAITEAINLLAVQVPDGIFLFALSLLPSNTSTCITAILSAHTAAILYRTYFKVVLIKMQSVG